MTRSAPHRSNEDLPGAYWGFSRCEGTKFVDELCVNRPTEIACAIEARYTKRRPNGRTTCRQNKVHHVTR